MSQPCLVVESSSNPKSHYTASIISPCSPFPFRARSPFLCLSRSRSGSRSFSLTLSLSLFHLLPVLWPNHRVLANKVCGDPMPLLAVFKWHCFLLVPTTRKALGCASKSELRSCRHVDGFIMSSHNSFNPLGKPVLAKLVSIASGMAPTSLDLFL